MMNKTVKLNRDFSIHLESTSNFPERQYGAGYLVIIDAGRANTLLKGW